VEVLDARPAQSVTVRFQGAEESLELMDNIVGQVDSGKQTHGLLIFE
jgi:hypothetical protein